MNRTLFSLLLFLFSASVTAGDLVVRPSPNKCSQGLYSQPPGGPFSVFLFCDDALGLNIGVINTSGAAGPGKIELPQPKNWDNWDVNNRFWQEPEWATDITSFGWSPDLKFLYVATSYIYGRGGIYKLDLVKRTYSKLLPDKSMRDAYESVITDINEKSGTITVQSKYFNGLENKTETIILKLK